MINWCQGSRTANDSFLRMYVGSSPMPTKPPLDNSYPQITQIFADYYLKIIPFRLYVVEEQLECQTGTLLRY